jgi:hypothetical protein
MPVATSAPRTRPFLKIQDGCDAFCTYCIVHLLYSALRTRSQSQHAPCKCPAKYSTTSPGRLSRGCVDGDPPGCLWA